jgi:hypothetical protein
MDECPRSLPFVPTGFAAVGRNALPDLPPACQRYEATPPSGYTLHCEAAVPLYAWARSESRDDVSRAIHQCYQTSTERGSFRLYKRALQLVYLCLFAVWWLFPRLLELNPRA